MVKSSKSFGAKRFFSLLLILLIATDFAILLNIPYLRQILGFFFLTIIPGILILQVLKLNKIGSTEKFVLAVGLSISFLMFFGLLINNLSLVLEYETPLATIPLLVSFNIAFIILAIIGYKINKESLISLPNLTLSTSEKAFLIVPILLPALSIAGMYLMNTTDNNIVLMFLLFLIPIYVIFVCFFNQKFPERFYPVVIFLIGISLLLLLSLRSNHIIGMDTHEEYYFFRTTLDNLHWRVFAQSTLDACLSISLLPTIYQSILKMPSEFLFKILYSILFSISPLAVFVFSKKYIGNTYAFLSSFFFMSQLLFLWTAEVTRTNTAILFFALAIMVLFQDGISEFNRRLVLFIFTFSCIVSHYSTTYILFFILLFVLIGMQILLKLSVPPITKGITMTFVLLFFTAIFFWYSQVTVTAFNRGMDFVHQTFINLNMFFLVESKGGVIGGTVTSAISIPQRIKFIVFWISIIYILIGMLSTTIRYRGWVSISDFSHSKPDFLRSKIDTEYFVLSVACIWILVSSMAVPYVLGAYNLQRLYFMATVVLSMYFVIGGIITAEFLRSIPSIVRFLKNPKKHRDITQKYIRNGTESRVNQNTLVVLAVLVPLVAFFLCNTGVVDQPFNTPVLSVLLNSKGNEYNYAYIHDHDSCAAKWLHDNGKLKGRCIYTDFTGDLRLISQGMIYHNFIDRRYLLLDKNKKIGGYIYLRYYNVVDAELFDESYKGHSITEYQDKFTGKGKIFNNGGSEVWR